MWLLHIHTISLKIIKKLTQFDKNLKVGIFDFQCQETGIQDLTASLKF